MQAAEIIDLMRIRRFVIYGNGYIARRLYNIIKKLGLEHNVLNVAVSNPNPNDSGVNGQPLCAISEINQNDFIILAVHNAVADTMKRTLIKLGFSDYIWIYPYLIEMEIGQPIRRNYPVPTDILIKYLPIAYTWAIYYLSLADYIEKGLYGGSLYIKFASTYVTFEMANRRWARFQRRIDECLHNGYHQDYNIKINEGYSLIDGAHRLVLAKYFHVNSIFADIYIGQGEFYAAEGLGGDILLHEKDLSKYYTADEIASIKAADLELRKTD